MSYVKPLAARINNRLVVVSNRGSYILEDTDDELQLKQSVSGLVSAVEPILNKEGGSWIAWGGRLSENSAQGISTPVPNNKPKYVFHEVLLTKEEYSLFYEGFSNSCMWPLCHNFLEKAEFREKYWHAYCQVNKKYTEVLLRNTKPKDLIWVHDYHLALLPGYIRKVRPAAKVAFYWHIPFPPAEIFAALPWCKEYLRGMLNAELIGFHTKGYVRNFLQCVEEILGLTVDYNTGSVFYSGRIVKTLDAPIGIDCCEFYELANQAETKIKAQKIREKAGGKYILLGVDRLDYTKGISQRLDSLAFLLEQYPQFRSKITFLQIAVPSRTGTIEYTKLREKIEGQIGRLNGLYTQDFHVPVKYMFKSLEKRELVSYYLAADMALVTPVKDGLNLVAKEYVAANTKNSGVLLLSPFAGAAVQLRDALFANPYNQAEMASQIIRGLDMTVQERMRHMTVLNKVIKEQDNNWWWRKVRNSWLNDSDFDVPEVYLHEPFDGITARNSGVLGGVGSEATAEVIAHE